MSSQNGVKQLSKKRHQNEPSQGTLADSQTLNHRKTMQQRKKERQIQAKETQISHQGSKRRWKRVRFFYQFSLPLYSILTCLTMAKSWIWKYLPVALMFVAMACM
jgi:predicted acyl esterase